MAQVNVAMGAGNTPLETLPVYGGTGGGLQAARYYAGQKFYQLFGRNPSEVELTQLSSAYIGGDKNIANVPGGDSAVAQYYQSQQNSPEKMQEDEEAKLKAKVPEHYDGVKGVFKETLGRDPNQQELDHFATMIARGDADAYTISQGLQTLPEYTKGKDTEARTALRGELSDADTKFLQDKAFPTIQAQFARQGRDVSAGNVGLQTALANAASELNVNRENYLATIGREDYTNRRADSINQYLQGLQRQYQTNDMGAARNYQLQDQAKARQLELENYYMQKSQYDDYLQNYGRRKGAGSGSIFGGAASGALGGAAAGSTIMPGWGTAIGGVVGAGLGAFGAAQSNRGIY